MVHVRFNDEVKKGKYHIVYRISSPFNGYYEGSTCIDISAGLPYSEFLEELYAHLGRRDVVVLDMKDW